MADLGDILGEGPERKRPAFSLAEVFAAQAASSEDRERRLTQANMAALLGPIAWAVYDHGQGELSMGRASNVALKAMHEVGSETITIVGYVQLTRRAIELAEEILGKRLTDTTRSDSVGDSTEDHTEGPEPGA